MSVSISHPMQCFIQKIKVPILDHREETPGREFWEEDSTNKACYSSIPKINPSFLRQKLLGQIKNGCKQDLRLCEKDVVWSFLLHELVRGQTLESKSCRVITWML